MSDKPLPESEVKDTDADDDSDHLREIHETAMEEFDAVALPQREMRSEMLQDRRFINITGAMWETGFDSDTDDLLPRPEIDKITKPCEKIIEDYRENRLDVSFLPAESADQDTADTLNDAFRADAHVSNAMLAYDNAFLEMVTGGMGAWRVSEDYADPYDPDNDNQRILPGIIIPDADQCVYFYGGVMPDGSDAKSAFVISNMLRREFDSTWGEENAEPFPVPNWKWAWDWYQPEIVQIAEHYRVEDVSDTVLIFTQEQSGEEQRFFKSEIEDGVAADLKAQGWKRSTRQWKRRRVRKYIMNGSRILKDCGYIAGDCIPIVVVYGRISWVDNQLRARGYVRKKKDAQRGLNSSVSRLMEIDSMAPFEVPIVADEQLDGPLMQEWAEGNIKRYPFRRLKPLRNQEGEVVSAGPIGKIEAPQVPPTLAAILQFNVQMLSDDDEQNQVPANTSAEAIELNQNRIDSRSVIYLDNFAQGLARTGVIYRGKARELYYEAGREIDTRNLDGQMGKAKISEPTMDPVSGVYKIRNDLTRGTYHVEASVQESNATKRQKVFRMDMELSQAFIAAQSPSDGLAILYDAMDNLDNLDADTREYFRQKALSVGIKKPTPEEQQAMQAAAQQKQQTPDPQQIALQTAMQESASKAALNQASAADKQASAQLKTAQAEELSKAPAVPTGLSTPPSPADVLDKVAGAQLKSAQAAHLQQQMGHQRIKTGADLAQQQHDQEMQRRSQDLAERQQAHAESQPQGGNQ